MKEFDNIEDWYRDELNNFKVNPDKEVWNSLSDDLDADMTLTDDNISEWYKREVNKLEERPDYTVWEKLATKLDTTSVWDKLVVSLNQYDKFIWWRNTILKSGAVLLLLTGSYLTYHNYINNTNNNSVSEINTEQATKAPIKDKATLNPSANKQKTVTASSFYTENSSEKNTNTTTPANTEIANENLIKNNSTSNNQNKTLYASVKEEKHYPAIRLSNLNDLKSENNPNIFKEIERRTITTEDISHIAASNEFLVKKEKNRIVFNSKRFSSYTSYGLYARRFYVGLNAGVKKQGLICSIKKDSPMASFNQVKYLDFGGNTGLTFGYILSDKINLETNINAYSSAGYKKRFNGEGFSYKENLNLNYGSVNLLAKFMNTKSTFDNKVYSTNLIAGIYTSWLYSANSNINGNSNKVTHFNNTDFGVVLGIEQDRYLSKTLVLTPGIRYNQGIANITNTASDINSARNYSLEFNIGLKYIFLKTSK